MTHLKEKLCSGCKQVLPVLQFSKASKRKDGLQRYCKACSAAAEKKRRLDPAKLARLRERDRQRYNTPERAAYRKTYKETNAGKFAEYERRLYKLRNKFGVTRDDIERMLEEQNHQCAICLVDIDLFTKALMHLDHDHYNGKLRALLCGTCNVGIGMLQDSPEVMRRAANYIKFWAIVHAGDEPSKKTEDA